MKRVYLSKHTLLALLGFLALGACTEEFDMETGTTYTRLCVDGAITTDTTRHTVKLTTTKDLGDNKPFPVISNAIVSITDGTNTFQLTEDATNKGFYMTDSTVYGVPGRTYTLSIKNVDIDEDGTVEEYTATSLLKNQNPVDSIHIVYNNGGDQMNGWVLNLYAKDPGGGRNFYLIKVRKNDTLLTDSVYKYSLGENTGFEGKYYDGFSAYFIQENTDVKVKKGDNITLEMSIITEDYYQFIVDFINEYYPKVPLFSGPSANITTNVLPKNKAVGFFAAYPISRKSRVYE